MSTHDGPVRAALDVLGTLGRADAPLGALTTYRVGGRAAVEATVSSRADVATVAQAVQASGLPVLVIGRGSNLLISDGGWPGIAVVMPGSAGDGGSPFVAMTIEDGSAEVTAGAGVTYPALARRSAQAGLRGLEWAVGVPGSVGGAVCMNAGGHGSDTAGSIVAATVADLSAPPVEAGQPLVHTLSLKELAYGYRQSSISSTDVVLDARFTVRPGDADQARQTIREIVSWRREHQPGGQNSGSVFTNPDGDSAGRLIEAAGQKGRRRGSAMVSAKHANFIQADAAGSADDVRILIEKVREAVLIRTGVELRTEVRMVGFGSGSAPEVSTSTGGPDKW